MREELTLVTIFTDIPLVGPWLAQPSQVLVHGVTHAPTKFGPVRKDRNKIRISNL